MRRTLTVFSLLVMAALACNMPSPNTGGPSTAVTTPPPAIPTISITVPAGGSPTESATQDAVPTTQAGVLPAPVYVLANDNQIWRIEVDGTTAKQITFEPAPVVSFDVSPIDGSVAFVSNNSLYNIDAQGGNRALLVQGPPPPDPNSNDPITESMGNVNWSHDGTKIAFGLGGVQIYDINAGQATMIRASDPYPDINNLPSGPIRFYYPGPFSPDNTHLMVFYGNFPEGGGTQILKLSDGSVTDLTIPEGGMVCCNEKWTPDSQSVIFSSPYMGYTSIGMWQAAAPSWQVNTLIHGETEGGWMMPSNAQLLNDGHLYYFYAQAHELPNGSLNLLMTRSDDDGVTNRETLRNDPYDIQEVLWDQDAKGAVVRYNPDPNNYSPNGPILWLPVDGSAAITLPKQGSMPHWGK